MKFDAYRETDRIIQFVRDYYKENNLKGAVLGISGGKDSGVVAGIMCKAIGAENVVGLTLPFLSYGGSSIVSTFWAMGIVSGIHMRPTPDGAAIYVRPPTE